MVKFLIGAIRARSDEKPAGRISRAFPAWIALSADSGFLDDRVTVAADLFHLGEALLGDVARPHVMAIIGPVRMAVVGTRVIRGDGHTCRLGRHCGKDGRSSECARKDNLFHDEPLFSELVRASTRRKRRWFNHIGLLIVSTAETFDAPDR
jgi:hypothetical protein